MNRTTRTGRRRWVLGSLLTLALACTTLLVPRLATAGPTAGCGKTPTLTNGAHSIQSSGLNRSYNLSIPGNYSNGRPYRLIFGLHWLNGTANDVATGGADGSAWAFYGQKQLSDNSTIFVAPQGIDNGWANTNGRDVTLVDDLVRLIEGDLCVDTSQVFAMGWSYGGAMSYALACARPAVFRAVVVYSGANLSGCNGGAQPVAYFGIHGTHDSVLNISSGRSLRDTFVRNNGCTAQSPREPALGSLTHITTAYAGCRIGYPVQWAAFDGDHTPSPVDGSSGSSGSRTWTSAEVKTFLAQFTTGPSPSSTTSPGTPPSSPPPASPSPSASAPPTACSAAYRLVNPWPGGFQGEVTVTAGGSPISSWTVRWTLSSGQTVTQVWNGTLSTSGSTVTVRNAPYNGSLAAGATTTFGFLANGSQSALSPTCTSP
ncbi:poly(3-hydroxybutyrate) depolymerase [Allocatelliglobosispora scoriae]|uniref:Poly(3-hydroxybutyrate) depolymerase n=1 Tax=Allocatelliglobosispora scoriae TaxID=643052 RepID=A0A841BJ09_9ACTN|nr:cellulose binding domain-containing protein [Allocatelliglobosispora scoriae]MBB5866762.1 poly(3-hydroxybutyrate) depolymerase [Allocatelliglobosispora scoriae]